MKKRIRNLLRDEKGTSIVSAMTAFIILLIGLSMVTTATLTAIRVTSRSAQIRKQTEKCMEAYYLGGSEEGITKEAHPTAFTLTDGSNTAQIPGQLSEFTYKMQNIDGEEESFILYYFENAGE